jgi:hypothetical protein
MSQDFRKAEIRLAAELISATLLLATAAVVCVGILIANTAAQPSTDADTELRSTVFGVCSLIFVVTFLCLGVARLRRTTRGYAAIDQTAAGD